MKTITIRGISPYLAEKLKQTASEQNQSLNQLVLGMIKRGLGIEKEKIYSREYDDLDDLFGRWTESEYEQIQKKIDAERKIDQELWE